MLNFATFHICPLTEAIFDEIIDLAGGRRAHPDHDRQDERNADYILGEAVVELKILDDEGFSKVHRQAKLAGLFTPLDPDRPVHVLDRNLLDLDGQRAYDQAMESPIKSAVKSAKVQLHRTREKFPNTTVSILILVNNANTALDHDEIIRLVSRRARNDTSKIDGVVVAGAYLHSDGIDTIALWPIDYVPIRFDNAFTKYHLLRDAFKTYAMRAMTASIVDGASFDTTKGPTLDTGFEADGKTFVRPAPPLSNSSDFYTHGRPRLNSTGIEKSPPVGISFPELSRAEWRKFRRYFNDDRSLGHCYEDWLSERAVAESYATSLKPLIPMTVTLDGWMSSTEGSSTPHNFGSVCDYANVLFHDAINRVIDGASDFEKIKLVPSSYVLIVTEQIGQDEANDVSHIALVTERPSREPQATWLVRNARIFHLYAVTLGASYAVKHGVTSLRWKKDLTYSWT